MRPIHAYLLLMGCRLLGQGLSPYRAWIDQDVAYIVTDEERKAFNQQQTDELRQQFIEQFWLRRDPTPSTVANEFKDEHYRRIAYAIDRFTSGVIGWKSDRGRIYVMYGPPDEIESDHAGGTSERPTYPFEQWRYRYIEGVGPDITIEFVDPTMSGEYRMTIDPSEKEALLNVPSGLTLIEQMGMAHTPQRFSGDGTHLGSNPSPETGENELQRLRRFAGSRGSTIKFKDLEAAVSSKITFNILPFQLHADYVPLTEATTLVGIAVQFDNKDLTLQARSGAPRAVVNVYGRITTMTRRVAQIFEEPFEVAGIPGRSILQKSILLAPGQYRLNVVAKDVAGGNLNNLELTLDVPHLAADKLAQSSFILADAIERVSDKGLAGGQFVIGDTKVRPRIDATFRRDEKLGIYVQFFNFVLDHQTGKPNGQVEYEVIDNGTAGKMIDYREELADVAGTSTHITIEKFLPLKGLPPGQYTIRIKVTDRNRVETLATSAAFTVT